MSTTPTPVPPEFSPALRAELADWLTPHRDDSRFANSWQHARLPGLSDVLRWRFERNRHRAPGYRARSLTVPADAFAAFEALEREAATRLFWIGHASFAVDIDRARLVIDPIFGRAGGVVRRVTPPAAHAEALGQVHAVLVTHGHHDHLDPSSLRALAEANPGRCVFVVPTGMTSMLPRVCRPVVELGWWEHVLVEGVRIHLVPAQHWHARGLFDRNRALWGGYVIEGTHRVYHSGDTGYFGGFQAIGRVFGGIDAACLPLGAYEPTWFMSTQHMEPEDSLRAYEDLSATHFVGMHWGTFDLSDEPLEAGPRWLRRAVTERSLAPGRFHVLDVGGSVGLSGLRNETVAMTRHAWCDPDASAALAAVHAK